jgi:hypothetical protein
VSAHKRGLGGTDVGPVVAFYRPELAPELAKYANATDVAMRIIHDVERPRSKVMSRGLDAEPRLRRAYLDAFPCTLVERPEKWIVQHPTAPWATCSPDDARSDGVLVEYKSTSIFARHEWGDAESDEVPPLYGLQVQWCLGILDLPTCDLFVGFGRDYDDEQGEHQFLYEETRRYVVPRDRELFAMAFDYCQRFQADFIERRKLPPLTPVKNKRRFSQLTKEAAP